MSTIAILNGKPTVNNHDKPGIKVQDLRRR